MTGYIIELQGQQFAPEGRVEVPNADAHNRALEAKELEVWAARPDRWSGYVGEKSLVVTFLGTPLGTIVRKSSYRNALTGSRMTSVTVRGTNGATYYGRYGSDWSELVRLRKIKEKK